jgi:YegS/Rv2252/BmrU family lipid kinase
LNPASKSFLDGTHRPEEIVAALQAVGITPRMELTTPEIDARQLARKALDRGDHLIIAAGGDGTIEEVATALIHSSATLGILPLGTMNNLARALGIPLDLPDAALLLAIGATRRVDLGRVVTPDNSIEGYFLETAGIGLSAIATPMGEDAEKGRWSNLLSKLGDFFAFTSAAVTIQCDDEAPFQSQTHLVTISNAPLFGNNMLVAPEAKIDDGLLDVVVYENMELVDLTRYFFGISSGGRVTDGRVHVRRTCRVQVTADTPLPVNADLDVLAAQPRWEVEIVPRALSVIVGNGLALTLPVRAAPVTPPVAGPPL